MKFYWSRIAIAYLLNKRYKKNFLFVFTQFVLILKDKQTLTYNEKTIYNWMCPFINRL